MLQYSRKLTRNNHRWYVYMHWSIVAAAAVLAACGNQINKNSVCCIYTYTNMILQSASINKLKSYESGANSLQVPLKNSALKSLFNVRRVDTTQLAATTVATVTAHQTSVILISYFSLVMLIQYSLTINCFVRVKISGFYFFLFFFLFDFKKNFCV